LGSSEVGSLNAISWPDEVRRVGLPQFRVAGLRETQAAPVTFAVAQIDGRRGLEVQVARSKTQDAQQPRQTSQVAVDDLLEVRHLASAPRLKSMQAIRQAAEDARAHVFEVRQQAAS
jgi:hypothetical protein